MTTAVTLKREIVRLVKPEATVTYPVHEVLLNAHAAFCRFLIAHGYIIVGFLSLSTEVKHSFDRRGLP